MKEGFIKALVAAGSLVSAGFGVWHFGVPRTWAWYSYIAPQATELVIAIKAINFFFSLSLVLFAAIDAAIALGARSNAYSAAVVLGAASVLWLARVVLQVLRPQGSMSPVLQHSLLAAFTLALALHLLPFAYFVSRVKDV